MRTPVLVVGGGPAGVVAALTLARRRIGVRVVERLAHASSGSRAKGLQPRTPEMLGSLGVLDEVLVSGGRFPRWRSYPSAVDYSAPDAPLHLPGTAPLWLFELMRDAELACIAFGDGAAGACAPIARQWGRETGPQIFDIRRDSPTTAEVVQANYGVALGEEVAFLVRPDGYVGLTADNHIAKRLGDYLPRLAART